MCLRTYSLFNVCMQSFLASICNMGQQNNLLRESVSLATFTNMSNQIQMAYADFYSSIALELLRWMKCSLMNLYIDSRFKIVFYISGIDNCVDRWNENCLDDNTNVMELWTFFHISCNRTIGDNCQLADDDRCVRVDRRLSLPSLRINRIDRHAADCAWE